MTNLQITSKDSLQKMSSIEISKLTGKEHKNVIADIRNQLFSSLYFMSKEEMAKKSAINKIQGLTVILDSRDYWKEVLLDKYHSDILVSGYEVKYRAAIVKRWHELENKQKNSVSLVDPSVLRGLLLNYVETVIKQEEKIKLLEPQADALKRIAINSDGSYCIRDAAKVLQIQEKNLKQWLIAHRWIYRRPTGTSYLAYSAVLVRGYMEHKMATGERLDGTEWSSHQARLTAKGIAKIAYKLGLEVLGEVA